MGLLTEYPYICKICKLLTKNHHYRRLIKILKVVIDRHSKKLLTMNREELNIFIEILHDLITVLHTESTIPLDQEFANSVLCQYIKMVELILNQATLNQMIPNSLKVKLYVMIISIYYDYCRIKECEAIIHQTIDLAQKSLCFYQIIKLVIIRSNYVALNSIDGDKKNKNDIDDMIERVLTYKYNRHMPVICDIFLRLLQIAMRMRLDESLKAGHLLIQTTNDLLKLINGNNNNTQNGRKRKFNEIETDGEEDERPRKRQRLSIDNEVFVISNNEGIMDADISFLINFCALMHLVFIVRNSAFENEKLNEMRANMGNLLARSDVDLAENEMTYFERKLMEFFTEKEKNSERMRKIDVLCDKINGTYFKEKIIPLLERTTDDMSQSKLLQHINWLNMPSLSSVLIKLFSCFCSMHNGSLHSAFSCIKSICISSVFSGISFGTLHLKMLIWSISLHLRLCQHSDINSCMIEIFGMMKNTDKIKKRLLDKYCSQSLFSNYYRSIIKKKKKKNKNSANIVSHSFNNSLILFDETENEMDLYSLSIKMDEINDILWMKSISLGIQNGDICNIDQIKSFLRFSAIKLHYLSSHSSLIVDDRKCTRNQVKRVHRLTLKQIDISSRFYIRLMLEVLRHKNNNIISTKAQKNQIKSIFNYIKQIFIPNKNTGNVLPFVALCVIYSYLTVNDDVIKQFNDNDNKSNMIKRRITFLKFIINQLFKQRTQSTYLYIISSVTVYLYKLMQKCKDYQYEMKNIKQFLQNEIKIQNQFINDELNDCTTIKQINQHSMRSFGMDIDQDVIQTDTKLTIDPILKKVVVNYHDHLYVAKS